MKLKHLIALIALALGLAAGGVVASAIAAGNDGASGGDVHTLAGRKPGASGGSEIHAVLAAPAIAASKPTNSGDQTEAGEPAIAGGRVITGDV